MQISGSGEVLLMADDDVTPLGTINYEVDVRADDFRSVMNVTRLMFQKLHEHLLERPELVDVLLSRGLTIDNALDAVQSRVAEILLIIEGELQAEDGRRDALEGSEVIRAGDVQKVVDGQPTIQKDESVPALTLDELLGRVNDVLDE